MCDKLSLVDILGLGGDITGDGCNAKVIHLLSQPGLCKRGQLIFMKSSASAKFLLGTVEKYDYQRNKHDHFW